MSLDSSLKSGAGLNRHRNVLTRSERLVRLLGQGHLTDASAHVMGLPKVANRKISVGKKASKKAEGEEVAGAPGAIAGAAPATPAAGGAKKGAAPAKGAAPPAAAAAPAKKGAPAAGGGKKK